MRPVTGNEPPANAAHERSEEHTSELQSPCNLVCRLLLEKKKHDTSTPLRVPLRSAPSSSACTQSRLPPRRGAPFPRRLSHPPHCPSAVRATATPSCATRS